MTKPTTLIPAIRDGQAHSTLKAAICALALAMALSSCSICQKHETACFVTATLVAGSLVASQGGHHNRTSGVDGRDYTIVPVDCAQVSCK